MFTNTPTLLSNYDIIKIAPAAGSSRPVMAASDRYSFVPTLTVVDALRDIGWFPIDVKQSYPRLDDRIVYRNILSGSPTGSRQLLIMSVLIFCCGTLTI